MNRLRAFQFGSESASFGMQRNDPVTIVLSVLGLGVIAILASWIPAVRAARLNPVQTLREE